MQNICKYDKDTAGFVMIDYEGTVLFQISNNTRNGLLIAVKSNHTMQWGISLLLKNSDY